MSLHPNCKDCARRIGKECFAITKPAQMWKSGSCWAFKAFPDHVAKELRDAVAYAHAHGSSNDVSILLRFLRRYENVWDLVEEEKSA